MEGGREEREGGRKGKEGREERRERKREGEGEKMSSTTIPNSTL